jgi:hypothetical protein
MEASFDWSARLGAVNLRCCEGFFVYHDGASRRVPPQPCRALCWCDNLAHSSKLSILQARGSHTYLGESLAEYTGQPWANPPMEQLPDGRMLFRAVGVSFEGRQDLVRKLRPSQELVLCKHSGNGYDTYAIGIFVLADCETPLGFVGRDIKHHTVFAPVRTGSGMAARVHRIDRGRGHYGP